MRYGGIETDKFTEEEVLFFIRIKGKDHFFNEVYSKPVINELFGHLMNHRTISEYPNADHYIDLKKFSWENFNTQDFTIFNKKIKPDLSSIIFIGMLKFLCLLKFINMENVFTLTITVSTEDIDNLHHVNNLVYVKWMDKIATSHWTYLTKDSPFPEYVWVVMRHEIDYLKQAS